MTSWNTFCVKTCSLTHRHVRYNFGCQLEGYLKGFLDFFVCRIIIISGILVAGGRAMKRDTEKEYQFSTLFDFHILKWLTEWQILGGPFT